MILCKYIFLRLTELSNTVSWHQHFFPLLIEKRDHFDYILSIWLNTGMHHKTHSACKTIFYLCPFMFRILPYHWVKTANGYKQQIKKQIEKKINSFRLRGCISFTQLKNEFIGSDNCMYGRVNKHIGPEKRQIYCSLLIACFDFEPAIYSKIRTHWITELKKNNKWQ